MRKTVMFLFVFLSGLLLAAVATQAQGGPPPMPVVKALDANGDGVIEASEIAGAPTTLSTLDKNGDGQLTPDELRPAPPSGKGGSGAPPPPPPGSMGKGHHPVPPLITALDTDGNGTISAAEIAGAATSLLTLDKNGDGQLTFDEFMPPPPPPPPAGQGGAPSQAPA